MVNRDFYKYDLRVITPPAAEPVSLAFLKKWVRMFETTNDDLLTSLIKTSRLKAEEFQNRAYLEQTLKLVFDSPPYVPFRLPRPPFSSITSIVFTDFNGLVTTMSTTQFDIYTAGESAIVQIKPGESYPGDPRPYDSLVVTYVAGNASTASVPEDVISAICIGANHLFDNPTGGDFPQAFYSLLWGNREDVPI